MLIKFIILFPIARARDALTLKKFIIILTSFYADFFYWRTVIIFIFPISCLLPFDCIIKSFVASFRNFLYTFSIIELQAVFSKRKSWFISPLFGNEFNLLSIRLSLSFNLCIFRLPQKMFFRLATAEYL